MHQFDVFEVPHARDRPYVLVLQTDHVEALKTVVVAPLGRTERFRSTDRLNPHIRHGAFDFVLLIHELAAIDRTALKKFSGNVAGQRDDIIRALDTLFSGW